MDKSVLSLILSIIAIIAAGVTAFSIGLHLESCNFLLGTLTLLVTILIGWQIYNVIDINKRIENSIETVRETVDENIEKETKTALFVSLAQLGMVLSHRATRKEIMSADDQADAIQMLLNALCVWSQNELDSSSTKDAYNFCIKSLSELDENVYLVVEKEEEKDLYVQAALKTKERAIIDFTERIIVKKENC